MSNEVASSSASGWHTTLDSSTPQSMPMQIGDVQLYQAPGSGDTVTGSNATGDPTPSTPAITSPGGTTSSNGRAASSDFNDDGYSDILWQNTNGQAAIWEMNGTNVISEAPCGRQSWAELESDRNRRLQRRRLFRHPMAEHERSGRDLGNERDQRNQRGKCGRQSWAELEGDRNGRLQRRRPFRHPVAEHERSGRYLGNERDERTRHGNCGRQSWAELESDRNRRLQRRRPFRHSLAEHETVKSRSGK